MSKLAALLREENARQVAEEIERASTPRDNKICELIDAHAKICYVCQFFCEHRTPEAIMEHGDYTGFCYYEDEERERREEFGVVGELEICLTVNCESTCSRFASIFPGE